ncbi:Crp/Fnr family transcriptional regulator [Altererythrobacter sp. GH1-8]|uniref:Crp/Fnr family transcriptional regulator n=1 Tax=Altererythrobacter sp. GH1-8 TaxID=3349333 RepID=UPI00374D7A61
MSSMPIPKGSVLFRPEDECRGFVVVRKGTIKVLLTAENGREIVLYRVRPGEICLQTFGCLVQGSRYSAEGVAETDLEIEIIPAEQFQATIEGDRAFRDALFSAVAMRFSDLERLVEDVALSSVAERLARALLRLASATDEVSVTHEALATEIGSARAVVSRQIGDFQRGGMIEAMRGKITLLDRTKLERLAHL